MLFGDLKTLKPGKVTSKIIKLATEDRNVLRYLFGNDAKIAVTETGKSLHVTLKGSMRVDLSPTTTWPKLLDNRTGKSPTTVRIDWGDGAKRVMGEGVAGKFRGVNSLLLFAAVGHDYWTWTREHDSDFVDLLVDIGITVSKAILTEVISTGIAYGVLALTGAAVPAVGVIIGVIAISVIVGVAIERVDQRFGISNSIQEWVNNTQRTIDYKFRELIHLIESGAVYNRMTI